MDQEKKLPSRGLSLENSAIIVPVESGADNPWLTLGIMNAIEDLALLQEWDHVLDVQTRVLGDREVAWLRAKGFSLGVSEGGSRGVLEVGSANGCYGSFLARSFPEVRVYGLEANRHLAARFDAGAADAAPNYHIDICKVGEDALPPAVEGRFDRCFLRFVLQHLSDPGRILRALHDALPVGGRLYVVEEDEHFFTHYPSFEPFAIAADVWHRVCAAGGSDSAIGRKLPELVTSAGFVVDDFDIVLRNNVEMGDGFLELFTKVVRMLHRTNPEIVSEAEVRAVAEGFEASRGDHRGRYVATYPQILLAATKRRERVITEGREDGPSARDKALLVHAMMLACYIDGTMNPEELAHVKAYARALPELRGEDFEAHYQEAKRFNDESPTLDAAVGSLREIRGARLRLKTFVCMTELALASGDVSPAEERLLVAAAGALGVDAATAARIREVLAIKFT